MAIPETCLVLIKLPGVRAHAQLAQQLRHAIGTVPGIKTDTLRVLSATDTAQTYLYLPTAHTPGHDALSTWLDAANTTAQAQGTIALLTRHSDLAGASAGKSAPWHYVVETDVEPSADADLNAWYDTEHLPGLAGVPGTVRAQRYTNATGSPRYHACYDLHTQETFGSPPWLAVRATEWSARVRPNFRNTIRTMFESVG